MLWYHRAASLLILVLSCLASIALGKDGNWDLLNYHFYTPYAALTGRLGVDYLPASTQTYLNPLMDIPTYVMITGLRPVLVGGIMGAFHGLNLVIIYHLTLRMFRVLPPRWTALVAAVVTVLAATGSIVRGIWGTFMGDLTMSVFVLAAVYILLAAADLPHGKNRLRALGWAGLLMGAGMGLKATALFHAVPLVGLAFFLGRTPVERGKAFLVGAAACVVGFLLTGGAWMLVLQQHFGSPFFPYFNNIFRSPYAVPATLTDFYHWLPETLLGHLALPFTFLLPGGGLAQAEIPFREWRPAVAFIALTGFGGVLLWRLVRRRANWRPAAPTLLLAAFFVGSWAIWQVQFSYYRYLPALEMLAPLLIAALVFALAPRVPVLLTLLGVLCVLLIPTTIPMDYGRRAWSDDYFEVHLPPDLDLTDAQVFIADLDRPLAYLVPFLPPSVQVLRLTSSMDPLLFGQEPHGKLIDEIVLQIEQPRPKYVLFLHQRYAPGYETRADVVPRIQAVLAGYGLELREFPPCQRIVSAFHTVSVCRIERSAQ